MADNRPVSFVLVSTEHGSMLVNKNDFNEKTKGRYYGIGFMLLNNSQYEPDEIKFSKDILSVRRKLHGDGVVVLDCGANIGVQTVEWSKFMSTWGGVIAFEPQDRIYYALAGNITINNCFNAIVLQKAVGSECKKIKIPRLNYQRRGSFGSLELKKRENGENIGQDVSYQEKDMNEIDQVSIDSYNFQRVDMIKIDVEGMELDVLEGAKETIEKNKPYLQIEILKTDTKKLDKFLKQIGYVKFDISYMNILAVPKNDPVCKAIKIK